MHETTPQEAEAIARLIGRGAVEAMRTEDFDALRAWVTREALPALPQLQLVAASETGGRAGANAIATTIWNASPLPSNGFRPRPRPTPGRNDTCVCGSGRKFKRCCGSVSPGFPVVPEEEAWSLLVGHLTDGELTRFAKDPALPPGPLAVIALEMRDRGEAETARAALAARLARDEDLDDRHEAALDVFLELEGDAREMDDFVRRGNRLAERLPKSLRATVYRHLVPAAIAAREIGVARELLDRVRSATPDEPSLAPLEVTTLLAAGELGQAAERARFWLTSLRRRGLHEEMPDAIAMLERTARDPEAEARDFRAAEHPFLATLSALVTRAAARPVRPYTLGAVAGDAVFGRPPRGVAAAEKSWRRAWPPAKPSLVSLDARLPDVLIQDPEPWLDVLREHPAAFDSLDVLDDLVLLAGPAAEGLDPGWDNSLLAPLLDRAAAIVRASAAAVAGAVRLPWVFWENRPALRLLSRLGYRLDGLDQADAAAAVYEEILRWNPNDNHGHRTWLINHSLRKCDDARALGIADEYPDDALADTLFGRGLALWRLGRRSDAEKALRAAAADRPLVAEALLTPELEEPRLTPGRVTVGGEDEAWLYRESMRDVWLGTPAALDFIRGLPPPPPGRGRRAKSRRRKFPRD